MELLIQAVESISGDANFFQTLEGKTITAYVPPSLMGWMSRSNLYCGKAKCTGPATYALIPWADVEKNSPMEGLPWDSPGFQAPAPPRQ